MSKRVAIYVWLVVFAALVSLGGLYRLGSEVEASHVRAAVCFAVLSIFAQTLGYQLARGAKGSIAFIPFLAIGALAPSWIAVVAVAFSVFVVEVACRRSAIKLVFNVAQHALGISLGVYAYRLLGGGSLLSSGELSVVPYVCLFAAFTSVNTLAVSGAIALSENKPLGQVWRANTLSTVTYDLLALPFVYVFARVYVHFGWIGAAAMATFVVGVRQLYAVNWQLQKTNQELLELMVAAIEARDPYTSGHSRRVAEFSVVIAQAIGLLPRRVERVRVAALLHDVGKIHEVFAPILSKPGRLTAEERAVIETHPIKSAELVQKVSQLEDVVLPVRHHHENWDGTGYPDGLRGDDIPLAARIITFADTIDAMTSDRPYRAALGEAEVTQELLRCRGTQFDPLICDALLASPLYKLCFRQSQANGTPVTPIRLGASKVRVAAMG